MRVLLDENLPHRLRSALASHEVFTVQFMGWAGIKNGQLLSLMEKEGFEVFLTADLKMRSQQNFTDKRISMVYLTAQDWPALLPQIPVIVQAIEAAVPGSAQIIHCGALFSPPGADSA